MLYISQSCFSLSAILLISQRFGYENPQKSICSKTKYERVSSKGGNTLFSFFEHKCLAVTAEVTVYYIFVYKILISRVLWNAWFEDWYWLLIKLFFGKMRKATDKSSGLNDFKGLPSTCLDIMSFYFFLFVKKKTCKKFKKL